MAAQDIITVEQVRERLNYDSETGVFTWRMNRGSRARLGSVVGSDDMHGYKTVRLGNRSYKLHRLAWLHTHGIWPTGDIDHINGVRTDNRIMNLRDVSRKVNLQNQRKAPNNKSTGVLGVYIDKYRRRYYSTISVNNKSVGLGSFDTIQEAQEAYVAAKRKLHEGCML